MADAATTNSSVQGIRSWVDFQVKTTEVRSRQPESWHSHFVDFGCDQQRQM